MSGEHKTGQSEREEGAPVDAQSLLCFRVAATWLAVPAESVEELCAETRPTPVPRVPAHIPGVINLRGRVLPLVDLQILLDLAVNAQGPIGSDAFARIAVVTAEGLRAGILCDEIRGVVDVAGDRRKPAILAQGNKLREHAMAEFEEGKRIHVSIDLVKVLQAAKVRR